MSDRRLIDPKDPSRCSYRLNEDEEHPLIDLVNLYSPAFSRVHVHRYSPRLHAK